MKLLSHHVELLTPLEKKVYASLIGNKASQHNTKQLFISQSHKYIDGDETVLPFPERSARGIMLRTLSEQLAKEKVSAAFMRAQVPHFATHIKSKLKALGTPKVYTVPSKMIEAAIYGNGRSPFWFFRENQPLHLKGLEEENLGDSPATQEENDTTPIQDIICAINPPPKLVADTSEYKILAVLLKTSELNDLSTTPLFAEAAHLGLHQVDEILGDRLWLTKES